MLGGRRTHVVTSSASRFLISGDYQEGTFVDVNRIVAALAGLTLLACAGPSLGAVIDIDITIDPSLLGGMPGSTVSDISNP